MNNYTISGTIKNDYRDAVIPGPTRARPPFWWEIDFGTVRARTITGALDAAEARLLEEYPWATPECVEAVTPAGRLWRRWIH